MRLVISRLEKMLPTRRFGGGGDNGGQDHAGDRAVNEVGPTVSVGIEGFGHTPDQGIAERRSESLGQREKSIGDSLGPEEKIDFVWSFQGPLEEGFDEFRLLFLIGGFGPQLVGHSRQRLEGKIACPEVLLHQMDGKALKI